MTVHASKCKSHLTVVMKCRKIEFINSLQGLFHCQWCLTLIINEVSFKRIHWRIQGGRQERLPPWGSKFFHFHAVFGKNLKNNRNLGEMGKILDPPLVYVAPWRAYESQKYHSQLIDLQSLNLRLLDCSYTLWIELSNHSSESDI